MALFRASAAVLPRVWHPCDTAVHAGLSCLGSGMYESEGESRVDNTFQPPFYCAGVCSPVRMFLFLKTFSRTERLEMLEDHLHSFF